MNYREQSSLSPIQKYILFNKFPWKLVLHTLLIIFTTYQVLSVVGQMAAQNRAQHYVLKHALLNQDEDSDKVVFRSLTDFQQHLKDMVQDLQLLGDVVISTLDLSKATYTLKIYYTNFDINNYNKTLYNIDLAQPFQDIFDIDDIYSIKEFLQDIAKIEFSGNQIYNLVQFRDLKKDITCLNWNFQILYDLLRIGEVQASLYTFSSNCEGDMEMFGGQNFLALHITVLALASISMYLTLEHLYHTGAEYMHHKKVYKEIHTIMEKQDQVQSSPSVGQNFKNTWKEIKERENIQSFDYWLLLSGAGGFFQIVGATIAILNSIMRTDLSIFKLQNAMLGLGCFLAWILSLKYLEYFQNISLMTGTLKMSFRNLLMFLIGIVPFFFGFSFLAQAIFWKYDNFSSSLDSMLSLFALSNGDIVLDSFSTTWPQGIFGQFFLVVFMVFFFTAVQNVLVAIIMEGYEKIKIKRRKQEEESEQLNEEIGETIEQEKTEVIEKKRQLEAEQDDDKELVIAKLNLSSKRVDRILSELDQITEEIEKAHLKYDEKVYLLHYMRENVDNLSRNIKYQISTMES